MRKIVLLLHVLMLFSCAKKVSTHSMPTKIGPWEVVSVTSSEKGVSITIKNTTDGPLNVIQPMQKMVDQQVDDSWKKVSILYCDCGSNCPPPPNMLPVEAGEMYTFSWDLQSEECEGDGRTMTTKKSKVSIGSYQARITYSMPGSREKKVAEIPFSVD